MFPGKAGMPAKPLRELVEEFTENPYFQCFIGRLGYQTEAPLVPSLLVEFHKRLTDGVFDEINELIIAYNTLDASAPGGGNDGGSAETDAGENTGTLILDATCALLNISFPQDVNFLNEALENLEGIIDDLCRRFGHYTPRMYRRNTRKDYLNLARCKKRTVRKIHKAIKRQLQYIRRDRKYIDELLKSECGLTQKQSERLAVINKVCEQ